MTISTQINKERILSILTSALGDYKHTTKENYAFCCPLCSTSKKKLEIDLNKYVYHCWVCNKSGNSLYSLLKLCGASNQTLVEISKLVNRSRRDTSTAVIEDPSKLQFPQHSLPLYVRNDSIEFKRSFYYMTGDRQIPIEDLVRYNIHYCTKGEFSDRIIVPSYSQTGNLNYYMARSYYSDQTYKYLNPKSDKNVVGFELFINWNLPIVLVEGVFDAMAIRFNAIPLFGKTISQDLKKKIVEKKVQKVYICLDNDARKQAIAHVEYLLKYGVEVYYVDLQKKDPAEIGFEKMQQLILNTKPIDLKELLTQKLK